MERVTLGIIVVEESVEGCGESAACNCARTGAKGDAKEQPPAPGPVGQRVLVLWGSLASFCIQIPRVLSKKRSMTSEL